MSRALLCERCWNPIDRTCEPFRSRTHDEIAAGDGPVASHVHALPCARPDTGEWDDARRGLSPAAVHHAAAQADDR